METTIALKESMKEKIRDNFFEIKKQSGYYRLYTFILNRVNNFSTIYLPVSGTLKNLKDKFEKKSVYYPELWSATEMNLSSNEHAPLEQEIVFKLNSLTKEELDLLLIECLKELKKDGLFENEIPEFSIYIQDGENNRDIEEYSFKMINGKSYWKHFKNRKSNTENSLTNLLLDKYNLR